MSLPLTTTVLLLLLSGVALSLSKLQHGLHDTETEERTSRNSPKRSTDPSGANESETNVPENSAAFNIVTFAKSYFLHWWRLLQQMMDVLKRKHIYRHPATAAYLNPQSFFNTLIRIRPNASTDLDWLFNQYYVVMQEAQKYEAAKRTQMLVLDSGSATAYRVDLGADLTNASVTSYSIPALQGFIDVDWDFVDDRLYILGRDYKTIQSVFLNGTDLRNVTVLEKDSYAIAVEPFDKIVFASILPLGGNPARVVSMDTDGRNLVVLRESKFEAPDMGIDYRNKYLYWTEYLCSCFLRVKYGEKGAKVKKKYPGIYVKQNPRAVDFDKKLLYGDARKGLYKVDLRSKAETLIYRFPSKSTDETVYDPRTDRLFLYNNENSTDVNVLTTDGTLLGTLEGISLTADKRKAVRIKPQ